MTESNCQNEAHVKVTMHKQKPENMRAQHLYITLITQLRLLACWRVVWIFSA